MARSHSIPPSTQYIRDTFAPEDELLKRIRESLNPELARIQVGPEEGKLLQFLIRSHHVRTVVEIGTLAGYSAIWMARALPETGHLYTCGKDPAHNALAKKHFHESDVHRRINLIEGDARDTLKSLEPKAPFDMIFIDADKASYSFYLDWAEIHIRKGGLIIGDNTFLFGNIWKEKADADVGDASWKAMREFNARLADPARYSSTLIPTEEGMTVAVKLF